MCEVGPFMDPETFRTKPEIDRAIRQIEAALRPFQSEAVLRHFRQIEAGLPSLRQIEAAYRPKPEAASVWTDHSLPPAFKSWLKKRLADPGFKSHFQRFQKRPCAEHYKPEVAVACLYLANHSPVELKRELQGMHKQFVGQEMHRANLRRLLKRTGIV